MISRRVKDSDQVRWLFDAKAAAWSQKYAPGGALVRRLACFDAALHGHVPTAGQVLDLGCGTGNIAHSLAASGMQVTGCDISKEMLRHAADQDLADIVEWVPLDTGWRVLPFPSDTFHAIIAASVLEYVESPSTVIRECARVLRPGGVMVCTMPNPAHPVRWMEWMVNLVVGGTGIVATARRSPRLNSYLVYLQISRHRHLSKWWSATAASCGLLAVPRLGRTRAHSPLRMMVFQRPDHRASSPLPDMTLAGKTGREQFRRDRIPARGAHSGAGRHRQQDGLTAPRRIRSSDKDPPRPPRRRMIPERKQRDQDLRGTLATNIALTLLAVVTGIIAARILGPTGEGQLTAIQTWPLLLGTLAMLGLDSAVVYFIARQPEKGKQLTCTATLIGLLSALAVGAGAWFALPFLLSAQRAQIVSTARIFLLVGIIFALVGIPHGSLRGARAFTAWNLFRVAPGVAWLCILLASWVFGHPNAIPLSEWYLGALVACGLPFLIVVNRRLQGRFRPEPGLAPDMLRFGIPSALTSLPQTINLRFDQMLIIAFLPARSLGFYVVAVAWSGGVAPLLTAVGSVLFPHVSAETDTERRGHLVATALQAGTLVAAVTSVPFMVLAPVGLPLVFGARFAPSVPSAVLLVPAGAILAWAGVAEEGLRGLGRPTIVLIAELVAALVTVAALPLLLHAYGILGAAVASLLGYSTIAIFTVCVISRSTHQPVLRLIFPRWAVTKSLIARSISLLPGSRHGGVRVD